MPRLGLDMFFTCKKVARGRSHQLPHSVVVHGYCLDQPTFTGALGMFIVFISQIA